MTDLRRPDAVPVQDAVPVDGTAPAGNLGDAATTGENAAQRRSLVGLVKALAGDRRIRYVIVGGISSVVYYGIFSGGWLFSKGHIPYLVMAVIANFLNGMLTYPLYRRVVFRTTGPWVPGFLRFYVVCLWALGFSFVGLPLLIELGHVPVLLAQAIIIVVSPIINYQMSKYWAFRR